MSNLTQDKMTVDALDAARGTPVYSSDGQSIGEIEEIFYDDETRRPEWIGIGTGFFGTKRVLVPLANAEVTEDGFTVPYTKDQVKDSPDVDGDAISQDLERDLYSYYGLGYSEQRSGSGLAEGAGGTTSSAETTTGSETLTRSEEELRVGKESVETGRVRLRKWVETEPVHADVELRRETARIEREPIDQPVSGAELGEQEVEVELRGERPVVEKQTIAKERISVGKDVETQTETVGGELRKERVDVEGDELTSR